MAISFNTPNDITVGNGPYSVAVGDFNKDGKLDAIVANSSSGNVSVLFGKGLGDFDTPVNYTMGSFPVSVSVGDFNGDGKLDFATANFISNNISIRLGNGAGGFGSTTNYTFTNPNPTLYPNLRPITVADFNGDGKLDLAAGSLNNADVLIFPGTALGTFGTPLNYTVGIDTRAIAVADFNDDGIFDFAQVKSNQSKVFVQIGLTEDISGNTTSFDPATEFSVGLQPRSVTVTDINKDGKLDLLVANSDDDNVSLLLGDGTGKFVTAINYSAGNGSRAVGVGDFNSDGRTDLMVANELAGTVSVLLNTSLGDTFVGSSAPNTFIIDDVNDTIIEESLTGIDTVKSSITYTLGDNLERLFLIGTDNIDGTGNELNNNIKGNSGNNTLDGGDGKDALSGGDGDDTLIGGDGNDNLNGGTGADSLTGGDGNDTYTVDNGGDTVNEVGTTGIDTVRSSIDFILGTNLENLILTGTDNIDGTGNLLNNNIKGNSGNNTLNGGDGNDNLNGGDGADTLIGGDGNDIFNGGDGADTLTGGIGNDTLTGGLGNDTLTGGVGNDIFRFNAQNEGIDTIQDFTVGEDKIRISASGFSNALSIGTLASSAFLSGAGITTASDTFQRLIYNSTNGALFFDADGSVNAFSAIQIATLSGVPALTAASITVIG
ncbi:FG-GAP-like repeat-containing protein [Anabaena azotica]|uniref:FG-GAP-like repeat-containing protein n=1 Tax=Anabaena azotica TaxID=197653 RepID=UPI0039A6EB57